MAVCMCHWHLLVANGCGYGNSLGNSLGASTTCSVSFGNLRTTVPRPCRQFSAQNSFTQPDDTHKLILEVKGKLEIEHRNLPVGKNGRDDEDMILWFLRDRKFSVEDACSKLTKAIKWRQELRVSDLTEQAVESVAQTGKSYVHDFLDANERPVLVVVASKHIPNAYDPVDDMKLCAFLIEKALSRLPPGKEQILGIFDLRGFRTENADMKFLTFVFDVFYYYHPKRLSEVLFVDAPFVFKPIWQMVKPLVKSYASLEDMSLTTYRCHILTNAHKFHSGSHPSSHYDEDDVRFCTAKTVRQEYFTDETVPASFRD